MDRRLQREKTVGWILCTIRTPMLMEELSFPISFNYAAQNAGRGARVNGAKVPKMEALIVDRNKDIFFL